jgi:hypothetical protein
MAAVEGGSTKRGEVEREGARGEKANKSCFACTLFFSRWASKNKTSRKMHNSYNLQERTFIVVQLSWNGRSRGRGRRKGQQLQLSRSENVAELTTPE